MSTLVVASTLLEIRPNLEREAGPCNEGNGAPGTLLQGERADFLITGVGQALCGVHVTRALSSGTYHRVVHAGIAGSFTSQVPIGSVAVVTQEAFGDLGAEDHGTFLDLFDMELLSKDQMPFVDGFLNAPNLELSSLNGLPRVRSVTVNRVLSEARSVSWVRDRYAPHIVNMEGAALFYAALLQGVPFVGLRAVSDMVGPRDKGSWRIPEAVCALNQVVERVLEEW